MTAPTAESPDVPAPDADAPPELPATARAKARAALPVVSVAAAITSLESILEGSDDARTYFRVCGGLASLLSRAKGLASEAPSPTGLGGCALPSRPSKVKGSSGAGALLGPALRALRAAALNEGNAGEMLRNGAVASAAVPALCGKDMDAAAAAAWLLHSLTELAEHRKARCGFCRSCLPPLHVECFTDACAFALCGVRTVTLRSLSPAMASGNC